MHETGVVGWKEWRGVEEESTAKRSENRKMQTRRI